MTGAATAYVIAVAGPPGAGKTTVSRLMAQRLPRARVLQFDDFQIMTERNLAEMESWLDRGGPFEEIAAPGFVEELAALRSSGLDHVIVDGPLGRAHPPTGAMTDFVVYLDTPLDLALSRVLRKMAIGAARAQDLDAGRRFANWLDTYLDSYQRFSRRSYELQRAVVMPGADVALDGAAAPERLADLALEACGRGTGR